MRWLPIAGNHRVDVAEVGMNVVRRDRLLRDRELVAADELGPAGAGLEREDPRDRLHVEVHVEVRHVVDAVRDVPRRVPVQEHPLERHVLAPGHGVRQGQDVRVAVEALGGAVDGPVLIPVEAVIVVGAVRRQAVERAGREDHADRRGLALRVQLGVRRDSPLAEIALTSQRPTLRGRNGESLVGGGGSDAGRAITGPNVMYRHPGSRRVLAGRSRDGWRLMTGSSVMRRRGGGRRVVTDRLPEDQPPDGGQETGEEQAGDRGARRQLHHNLPEWPSPGARSRGPWRTGRLHGVELTPVTDSRERRHAGYQGKPGASRPALSFGQENR